MTKFIAFMAHLPHTEVDYLEETLQEYESVTQYIIAMETSPPNTLFAGTPTDLLTYLEGRQHFHFLTDMSAEDYHKFSIRVFRNKYHLRGQATKGLARQYGKLKEIKDFDKMASYTCKDGNIRTNMNDADIKLFKERSFRKNEKLDFKNKIFKYLKELKVYEQEISIDQLETAFYNQPIYRSPHALRIDVLHYFRKNTELVPSRSQLNSLVTEFMMKHDENNIYDLMDIDAWICGNISVEKYEKI